MGSSGKTYQQSTVKTKQKFPTPPNPQQKPPSNDDPIAQETPNDKNTPVEEDALTKISKMSDDELAQFYNDSYYQSLPNQLNDRADETQKFVFKAGMNEKPTVLDDAEFNQFLKDNNISQGEVLARSISPASYKNAYNRQVNLSSKQIAQMFTDSRVNYIGGKVGGQMYGAGTYFAMTGGNSTGYASGARAYTMNAVLNPKTAKVISQTNLFSQGQAFLKSHPKLAQALGGTSSSTVSSHQSIIAMAMGYNVISDSSKARANSGDYYNVIDRKALVVRKVK